MADSLDLEERDDLVQIIDDNYKDFVLETEGKPREYLGASQIGKECERQLWYQFRHAYTENFDGRMFRLFARGKREEEVFVEHLKMIGCNVDHVLDDQLWVDLGPFLGGHPDGIIESGLPGSEKTRQLVEFKTFNDKSFKELVEKGVRVAKPEHYVQMQLYCYALGIKRWVYMAVNKNDDTLKIYRGHLDEETAKAQIEKAKKIVFSDRAPVPLHDDPSYFKCKWCDCNEICHQMKTIDKDHISCHTCRYGKTGEDGQWHCTLYGGEVIPDPQQTYPCHVIHPDMALCWQTRDTGRKGEMGYVVGSSLIRNGGNEGCVKTQELLTNPLYKIANDFNGRIET